MSSFDAGRIVATADLDRTPFQRGLRLVRDEGKKLEQEKYQAKVGADTTAGERDLSTFKQRLDAVARDKATARVALDNGEAVRKLVTFQERLDAMRAKVATARVDADTTAAKAKLDALDIQLRRVGTITARPRVTLAGVERANLQLDALGLKLAAVGGAGGGGHGGVGAGEGGGFLSRLPNPSGMALAVGAAVPAAVPFAALGGGILGGALSAGASGALGLGAFGAGAKSSVQTVTKDVQQLTKLTNAYDAATTNKQRAAVLIKEERLWKSLDPAQRAAVKNVQALDASWARYKKRLEPQTFAVLADGAKIANTGLKYLLPTAQAVGDELDIMAKRAEHAFKSPFWHQFFGDFLPGEAARSVDALGTTLGNVGTGVAHLVQDFAPLAHLLEGGSTSLSARFEKWTEGAGPGKFVTWVEKEGPPAAKALGALATGVDGLAKGFAPLGSIELKALTPILNFIGKLGDEHPGVITALGGAFLTLGAGLKAVKLVGSIPGLGRIGGGGGLGGGGGILGKAAPVPVYVTNWQGGPHSGPVGTATKTATTTAEEEAAGRGSKNILVRAAEKIGVRGAVRGAFTLGGPIADVATLAVGDSAHDPNAFRRRAGTNVYAGLQYVLDPAGRKDFPRSAYPGNKLNIAAATTYLATNGNAGQLAGLQQLAKLYPQVAAALRGVKEATDRAADSIDREKSSVAALRAQYASLGPAYLQSISALAKLPGFLAAAESAALNGGFVVGRNLKKGIIIGFQQSHGTVQFTNITQSVNGRTHVQTVKAQLAAGGEMDPGNAYLVGERGPEIVTPRASGQVHPNTQLQALLRSGRPQRLSPHDMSQLAREIGREIARNLPGVNQAAVDRSLGIAVMSA